uniref:Reverse transcriptase Ty1/copia-type domain-containing protein n=1 Tax=Tanacetum cinerariifolium TaxID=118510 RepID=A0A6L2KC70_TANCI|nr:hypothetical protein [Tanacetum cinerariifolium]
MHMVPTAVLPQSKSVFPTTARPVSAALPNLLVTRHRHAHHVLTKSNSPFRKHLPRSPSSRTSNSPPRVTAVKALVVSAAQGLHRGYVAFGGNPKGGNITGKGRIKAGKLDFDDVYFVKELKFNLFSVSQIKSREEVAPTYVLFPVWSDGSTNPQNNDINALFDRKEHDGDPKQSDSVVILSSSSSAHTQKQVDKTENQNKGKSPVKSLTLYRDLNVEFEDCSNNSSNEVNAAGSLIPTVEHPFINSTNIFSADGPSNTAVSLTYEKSSFIDDSTSPHDPDMPDLEDINYSNDKDAIGAEADLNNLESSIPFSPIPTTKIHKDHPISQIIGDLSLTIQTRSMARVVKDQGFMVYQMDVKSTFLYGTIKEEVYMCQPLGFEDPDHPDKVYKVVKAFYGLHQAPRAWYETLATYLLENGFQRGTIDQTLFIKKQKGIFCWFAGKLASTPIDTKKPLLKDLDGEDIDVHTYRSMIGSLMYLTSSRLDIMFAACACTYFQVTPKASHLHTVKRIFRYLKGKPHLGLWYPKDSPFDLVAYSDSDYAEAKYVAAASGYAQVLWIQNQLLDYGYNFMHTITRRTRKFFTGLDRMGYEKPSTKLTFYKAFFSSQWKFLIHTVLQSLSAKRTSWNEFSSAMAFAVICLSTGRKFNFSKYIFESLVRNVDSSCKFYMYPRVGKGFLEVETPLFEGMLIVRENVEEDIRERQVLDDAAVTAAQHSVTTAMEEDIQEQNEDVELMGEKEVEKKVEKAKDITVSTASVTILAAEPQVPAATPTVVPVAIAYTKRQKRNHVKQKPKEDKSVQRYQVMKKRPQMEAQARKNMITYLKNTAGFRLDYFKGISYNDIRPIFEAMFNTNIEFLLKSKEKIEEEDNRAIESINETLSQKVAKRRKLNEEVKKC